jgi:hypothetical protein
VLLVAAACELVALVAAACELVADDDDDELPHAATATTATSAASAVATLDAIPSRDFSLFILSAISSPGVTVSPPRSRNVLNG